MQIIASAPCLIAVSSSSLAAEKAGEAVSDISQGVTSRNAKQVPRVDALRINHGM
jgi:hypothetical protein